MNGRSGRDGQGDRHEPGRPPVDPPTRVPGGPAPPRPMLIAAGVLALATFVGAGVARWTGTGHIEASPSPVVAARDLWFDDAPGGAVVARTRTAAGVDSTVATMHSGEGMFVRGALRALARGRRRQSESDTGSSAAALAQAAPFRLTRYADGRLTLDDPSTGAHLELRAFGPTNEAAFEALLPGGPATR